MQKASLKQKSFDFTHYKLDRLGISNEKVIIPWKDIQGVVIHDGAITICKKTRWPDFSFSMENNK